MKDSYKEFRLRHATSASTNGANVEGLVYKFVSNQTQHTIVIEQALQADSNCDPFHYFCRRTVKMIRKVLLVGVALLIATSQCVTNFNKAADHEVFRRDNPTLNPEAMFSKVELAQIRQGINDACQLALAALSFAYVSTLLLFDWC